MALISSDPYIATVEHELALDKGSGDESGEIYVDFLKSARFEGNGSDWTLPFNISSNFLGFTRIKAKLVNGGFERPCDAELKVGVVRKKTVLSKLFAYSVAILISLAYINLGAALDLKVVKDTLKRPVGPLIGFVCQYVLMPLISFSLGLLFYRPEMRLGLFVTGCSPGGGASNIWTIMFGGNLNLSVTMTAVSTFAAFFMMPLWIFSLGRLIFEESDMVIPYQKICVYAVFLAVPLCIGVALAKYKPKVAQFLVRILKPLAVFLILFILIFGIWANFYMFYLFTWKVVLVGMGLPWLGFAFGCTTARLLGRTAEDVTAIAIETGIQNTGVSIFMLWFTLDHPMGDIAGM